MYEAMLQAKEEGKIRHIGITTHRIAIAEEIIESGLYETLQYPMSYLADAREIDLIRKCKEADMGFIGMKGLAGGLLTDPDACMAFTQQFDNLIPIWGVQRMKELQDWLEFFSRVPSMDDPKVKERIEKDKAELQGEFCRGCGYCMPCPAGILINNCARMSLMLRRAPSANWLTDSMQAEMKKIEDCKHCGACKKKCPYGLDTPKLLEKNYEDYKKVLAGEVSVR